MRTTRPRHRELTDEQRHKANCRSYTKVLQRRGVLPKGPCGCGAPAQNHHPDYDDPRTYVRVCPPHHRDLH